MSDDETPDDEFERGMAAMRAEEAENARRRDAYRKARQSDRGFMLFFGGALLLVVVGILGWMFWGYLNTGEWPSITIRTLTHWSFVTNMVGLNSIADWFLDLWLGWYPLAFGALAMWVVSDETNWY